MALAGEDLEEIGADSIDAAELGAETAEAEIGLRLDRGEQPRPRLVLRPGLRVRADQRRVHDLRRPRAADDRAGTAVASRGPTSTPFSRRSPTSGSSTAAPS